MPPKPGESGQSSKDPLPAGQSSYLTPKAKVSPVQLTVETQSITRQEQVETQVSYHDIAEWLRRFNEELMESVPLPEARPSIDQANIDFARWLGDIEIMRSELKDIHKGFKRVAMLTPENFKEFESDYQMAEMVINAKDDAANDWYLDQIPPITSQTLRTIHDTVTETTQQGPNIDAEGVRRLRAALNAIIAGFRERIELRPEHTSTLRNLQETLPDEQPGYFLKRAYYSKRLMNTIGPFRDYYTDGEPGATLERESTYLTSKVNEHEFEMLMGSMLAAYMVLEDLKVDNEKWYCCQSTETRQLIKATGESKQSSTSGYRPTTLTADSRGKNPSTDSIPSITSTIRDMEISDIEDSPSPELPPKGKGKGKAIATDESEDRDFPMPSERTLRSGIHQGSSAFPTSSGSEGRSKQAQGWGGGSASRSESDDDLLDLLKDEGPSRRGESSRTRRSRSPPVSTRSFRDRDSSETDWRSGPSS